ncbi:MAG TPA: hypothetical protein VJT73_04420 [Polyangiaceae bacterium]|nr:hypothetical protein [Polyangiaceae bacterium]
MSFHRQYLNKVLTWWLGLGRDANVVTPWTSVPSQIKQQPGWNQILQNAENRLATNSPVFASTEEVGRYIDCDTGLHGSLHTLGGPAFNESALTSIHSAPTSTYFYQLHGLVDYWWANSQNPPIPGYAHDIGIGLSGDIWVVGDSLSSDGLGRRVYRYSSGVWSEFDVGASRIDVGPSGPWITNEAFQIKRWTGSSFEIIPGAARDVGIGANGDVWVIGTNAVGGGHSIHKFLGLTANPMWSTAPGGAEAIDVGPDGSPWVVNQVGYVYRWNGAFFEPKSGVALDISVGADGNIWVVGTDPIPNGYGIFKWDGNQFNLYSPSAGAMRISGTADGHVGAVNAALQIHVR